MELAKPLAALLEVGREVEVDLSLKFTCPPAPVQTASSEGENKS